MLRWWLVLVLVVASATAWAQPATLGRAQDAVVAAARTTGQLAGQRDGLRQRLNEELAAIDRLKQGPRGWRTKSQLEDRLSDANETRKQLEAAEARLADAHRRLAAARGQLVAAIDVELAAAPTVARAEALQRLRAQHVAKREARRIVLPDTKIDPRLDPEELDEQVAAIREGEATLDRQIAGLESQAKELQRIEDLRRQHDRTLELDKRDDNTSRRNAQQPAAVRGAADSAGGLAPSAEGGGGGFSSGGGAMFETDAQVVLPEVVEPAILDGITKAQRSGDPGQRAVAVRKARDAVATKRDQLRKKRLEIETLAKQRRQRR